MPGVYFAPIDERNQDYANSGNANLGRWPLGHTIITPDDRVYRFTLNDATAELPGNLYQSVVTLADHRNATADVARAIDAVVISATLGATLASVDIYAEGTVHTNDAVGEGYTYRIRRANTAGAAHAAVAASGIITANLLAGEQVQVALTTASQVSFARHRFHQVLITAAPPTGNLAGVSPGVAAANRFYWSQVKGLAAVLADGTLLEGKHVQASIATAGAVESLKTRLRTGSTASATTTLGVLATDQDGNEVSVRLMGTAVTTTYDITGGIAYSGPRVGRCVHPNASTEYALIDLDID